MLICNPELEKWRQGDLEFKMTLGYRISWRVVQGSEKRRRETGDGERWETGETGDRERRETERDGRRGKWNQSSLCEAK